MIKTKLGDEVRECLRGRGVLARAGQVRQLGASVEGMQQKWGQKVKRWQALARKYQRSGLSQEEVAEFLSEIKGQKTQADLVLELTVRSEDLKDASSEVRVFMDRLLEDLAVKYPPASGIDFGLGGEEKKSLVKGEVEKKVSSWKKVLALGLQVGQVRGVLTERQVAVLEKQEEAALGFLEEYLQQERKRWQAKSKSPFKSLKIRIFGAD
jgi:hypothetical protein